MHAQSEESIKVDGNQEERHHTHTFSVFTVSSCQSCRAINGLFPPCLHYFWKACLLHILVGRMFISMSKVASKVSGSENVYERGNVMMRGNPTPTKRQQNNISITG